MLLDIYVNEDLSSFTKFYSFELLITSTKNEMQIITFE